MTGMTKLGFLIIFIAALAVFIRMVILRQPKPPVGDRWQDAMLEKGKDDI